MKYYSEKQVKIMLENQINNCAYKINSDNSDNPGKLREIVQKTPMVEFPMYGFDSDLMGSKNEIRLDALTRFQEELKEKGIHARTVLFYQIMRLKELIRNAKQKSN